MPDLRYALRTLLRSPGFAVVAVLTLALGIGANTAMFSLVHAVLLRPLPVRDADRLVSVFTTDARNPGNLPMSHLNYLDLRAQNEVFTDMAAFTFAAMDFDAGRGVPEPVDVQVVSGNYFDVLGLQPAWGRGFIADEDRTPGSHPVAVLSHGFWQRQFGGAPMDGRTISLNRTRFTVVGVAPRDFNGVFVFGDTEVWVPFMMHDVAQRGSTSGTRDEVSSCSPSAGCVRASTANRRRPRSPPSPRASRPPSPTTIAAAAWPRSRC